MRQAFSQALYKVGLDWSCLLAEMFSETWERKLLFNAQSTMTVTVVQHQSTMSVTIVQHQRVKNMGKYYNCGYLMIFA